MFADIILPIPLEGLFTYAVPESLKAHVTFGVRVLVPFGRSKNYIGIVAKVHDNRPEGYQIKDILQVLDTQPILLPGQYRLWSWIADYYMAPIGDVYKAALPAGLKAEEGYKPRTETYVRLTEPYRNITTLHVALNILSRAPKQQQLFICYLQLSGWDMIDDDEQATPTVTSLTKEELLNYSGATLPILTQLVKRGMLETYEVEVSRLNRGGEPHPENIKPMSGAQTEAYNKILLSFMQKRVTLLHGVTSSGKTEIYIHLIQREIEHHRQVLYLLPEIALTVQIMERLQRVFGSRLGIYHSKYSDAERVEIWQKQLSAHPYDVILGARSAVFLPFQNLGLVIVDEEHETSFKQQDPAPRYHARSVAIMMAQHVQRAGQGSKPGVVLLGTATPSAETYHNAMTGKYGLVELKTRYSDIAMPHIEVVNTADLQHRKKMNGPFSPLLLSRVREALDSGQQAILFLNRRGYAPMIECKQCGWVPRCEHCDVSLTLHRTLNQLTCHYCGYTYSVPATCPACGSKQLQGRGYGTEKIEDQIRDIFPTARLSRMDLDTTRTRQAYERLINDFSAGRTNLLIGTQMISKGLDFDHVSVVGILGCDQMLNMPDFRAYEQAFTMMAQVSGRAGRKGQQGLVVIQTRQPELPLLRHVVGNDYRSFYQELTAERQAFRYPPFTRLVYVYLKHKSDLTVETAAHEMGSRLRYWFADRVLGPDKPPVSRIKTLSIRKLVLKLEPTIDLRRARQCMRQAQQQMLQDKRYASLQIYYDVDPL